MYDETNGDVEAWDAQCGDEFWALQASGSSSRFDWASIKEDVTSCTGGTCISGAQSNDPRAMCSKECASIGTEHYGGNGCLFYLNRYAAQYIYVSQVRAASVLKEYGLPGNSTLQQMAAAKLGEVQTALTYYLTVVAAQTKNASAATSAVPLLRAQISSLTTLANFVVRMPAAGFVPTHNRDFYSNELKTYMAAFKSIMSKLQESISQDKLLKYFAQEYVAQQAELDGKEGVNAVERETILQSMATALKGMKIAQEGMRLTGIQMQIAAAKLREALEDYQNDQIIQLSITIAFTAADIVTDFIGDMAARAGEAAREAGKVTSWFQKKSTYYFMKFVTQFRGAATDMGYAFAALDKITKKMPPDVSALVQGVANQVASMGLPPPPKGNSIDVISIAADKLNRQLLELGTGAWSQYVTSLIAQYDNFLTGFNSKVSGAAQHFIDEVHTQAAYGNDWTTSGTRFVANVQQFLVNEAQAQALNETQNAIKNVYGVLNEEHDYDIMQQGVMSIQITTLALQMNVVIEELCSTFEYQTTRLYHQCVSDDPSSTNKLQMICGRYAKGGSAFTPFFHRPPCQSNDGFANAANSYLSTWTETYTNVMDVVEYVTNAVWGTDTSATDSPFVSFTLEVWSPKPCDGSHGYWESEMTLCNTSMPLSPNTTYIGDECLAPGAELPPDLECCNVTRWNPNCVNDEPPSRPYITSSQLASFSNTSSENWGKLRFLVTPESMPELIMYDAAFVRGISVYLEGAEINTAVAGNLFSRLTPAGSMITRVKRPGWSDNDDPLDKACQLDFWRDHKNLCMFNNYTFHGSPSGSDSTVSYTMYYHNVAKGSTCPDGTRATPVFYNSGGRELECDGEPCFYYCTNLDFESLETGNAESRFNQHSPYNFASVYSAWDLQVYNHWSSDAKTSVRSAGLDLSKVTKLHLGIWLKTNGENNQKLDTCDRVGQVSSESLLVEDNHDESID